MRGGSRAGAGRKPAQIDLKELEKLCLLQCSEEEIAAWFSVSVRTIQTRRKQARFAEVMRRGKVKGCISVRRAQMQLLEAGNATIAVWLGKNLLGQKETMPVTGANGGPVQTESKADYSQLSVEELRAMRATLAKVIDRGAKW
jgi:hypothetical protein